MADNNLFDEIKMIAIKLSPSLKIFKIRNKDGIIQLGFSDSNAFAAAVVAASGANIKAGITGTFLKGEIFPSIENCIIELYLDHECRDIRLIFFLYETIQIKFENKLITSNEFEEYRKILKLHELALDTQPSAPFDQ
ncbi:hypothetical protein FHR59_002353 [Xanthomonas arboricola]|uniref:hypothetical protein n=1 Tax=Xanthomonas TaxID=338 RepID=UPI001617BE5E|nr:hypothetical protein [Xanthomonas arboricola]MBB4728772.1 hypothetical protein [Xanthomonas arboricola]MBB6338090.1 hypothetical protein [Xanthomonas arboricola]